MTLQNCDSAPAISADFTIAGAQTKPKKKRLPPLSVRLSAEQRTQLERDAVRMSLNAYVLASKTMDRHLTYVAMTRHRKQATLYSAKDEFQTCGELSKSLSRNGRKQSSLDFTTATRECASGNQRWRKPTMVKETEAGKQVAAAKNKAQEKQFDEQRQEKEKQQQAKKQAFMDQLRQGRENGPYRER